jgi:hypothetical protein
MRETIMKGWDKTSITKAFSPTFQFTTMEALFKEPTIVQIIEKINIDIDPIMPMSTIVKNYLQPTLLTTCAELTRT